MADLRTDLERLGERAAPQIDAFERLERRRRRKERNRQIGAGALALALVIVGSLAAWTAFRDADAPTVGGGGPQEFFALWPEQTAEGLAAAQERVDAGDKEFAWRTDPLAVADRFARDELLWPSVDIEVLEGADFDRDEVVLLMLWVPPETTRCDQIVTDATCPDVPLTLTLERSAGGLWSITEVAGSDFALPLIAGDEVQVGTTITVPTKLPDGDAVSMGVALLSACEARGGENFGRAVGGLLEFTVPDVPDGCVGYVYAIRPPTAEGAVAIGSFLFTDAEDVPAIGYLLEEIAAVPVRFVNQSPADVAEFTCDDTGTISPSSALVEAQPDGVHVAVTNTGDVPVSFSIEGAGGDGAEPGERKETVWQIPPGNAVVSCSVITDAGSGIASSAGLTVVDPNGYFVPAELDCAAVVVGVGSYGEGATGFTGDPVQVARDHLSGLEFDDGVERALYPESDRPVVRVVRDGAVVATVSFFDDGQGGWLVDMEQRCEDVQIGFSEEPTGVTGPPGPSSDWEALCAAAYLGDGNNIYHGADLHVHGHDIDFDTDCLVAPGGEPLTIVFSNLDAAVQRNISVYAMVPCLREALVEGVPRSCPPGTPEAPIFRGEFITGVAETVYELGPLEPGEYYFQDDVHPGANGVLIVEFSP